MKETMEYRKLIALLSCGFILTAAAPSAFAVAAEDTTTPLFSSDNACKLEITPITALFGITPRDEKGWRRPASSSDAQNTLAGPYIDSKYATAVPFGFTSQWIQPWRGFSSTVTANHFLNGLGANLNVNTQNVDLVMKMLADHGITRGRIEISWGALDYATGTQVINPDISRQLQSAKAHGIRPLILLNANEGFPCPAVTFTHQVTADSQVGDRTLQLDDVSNLRVGLSGISNLSGYIMAEALVTSINGKTVNFSKPLAKAFTSGTSINMATLKYKPFSTPGSAIYNAADAAETLAGWKLYTQSVAQFVASTLGVALGSKDMGFDLEVYNELTFGWHFLYQSTYYNEPIASDASNIWAQVVQASASAAAENPAAFAGVVISDGFANTIPWPSAGAEPAQIGAMSKHPYPPVLTYPKDQQRQWMVNALFQYEPDANFLPTYSAFFPEYSATYIQTESIFRDMGPFTENIYGFLHGRNARQSGGVVNPVQMFITETGIQTSWVQVTDPAEALLLKTKNILRTYLFYLAKGADMVDVYAALGADDLDFGIVSSKFANYAQINSEYPVDDSAYVSPALRSVKAVVDLMKDGLDPQLSETTTWPFTVNQISDSHNHAQFLGDGTLMHPPLYDRELFTILAYQVNAKRFVIPYYIMTRDIHNHLAPEEFTIDVSGLNTQGASLTIVDPITGMNVPFVINQLSAHEANITLTATDYPYLMVIQEQ